MKYIILTIFFASSLTNYANDTLRAFKGFFYNKEYRIYLNIDLYNKSIIVPEHEIYGELPGYIGKKLNNFCWLITNCTIHNNQKATIQVINDYGSEDLEAELINKNDSVILYKHVKGSPLKVPNNGKWQKLPKEITLIKVQ